MPRTPKVSFSSLPVIAEQFAVGLGPAVLTPGRPKQILEDRQTALVRFQVEDSFQCRVAHATLGEGGVGGLLQFEDVLEEIGLWTGLELLDAARRQRFGVWNPEFARFLVLSAKLIGVKQD